MGPQVKGIYSQLACLSDIRQSTKNSHGIGSPLKILRRSRVHVKSSPSRVFPLLLLGKAYPCIKINESRPKCCLRFKIK